MWRLLLTLLALNIVASSVAIDHSSKKLAATKAPQIKSTREISPVFRRKPFTKTSSTSTTDAPLIELDNKSNSTANDDFFVGKEHYYDNKIDILQGNIKKAGCL